MYFRRWKRREFMTLVGGAGAAWPLAAGAQQGALPVIGLLHQGSTEANARFVAGFRKGLAETGYVEGRNVSIEYRWGHGEVTRLPELAADLVRRAASVIVTPGGVAAALAAKAATATIPIVFVIGVDPVQAGLVVSLNRPGGNVTGITSMNSGLAAKQLGLLHQLLQRDARFAVLVNSSNPQIRLALVDVQAAAAAMGHPLDIVTATTNREITPAFKEAVQKRADAILISPDPLFASRPVQLATLAARHAMPAIYALREFAEGGGLLSYGSNFTEMFRQAGTYVARILKSEKPADLPILQATKFELVINLQTAEAFGLDKLKLGVFTQPGPKADLPVPTHFGQRRKCNRIFRAGITSHDTVGSCRPLRRVNSNASGRIAMGDAAQPKDPALLIDHRTTGSMSGIGQLLLK
jgi:putative ABC transport system substrate-binding protein